MKALVCDICGKTIDKEGMYERYSLWMKDPQGEHSFWPKRMDICYDCLEKLKAEVHNASVKKVILDDDAAEKFVSKVLGGTNEESGTPVEENGVIKARKKRAKKSEREMV